MRAGIDAAHLDGELKSAVVATPERFVVLDADTALTLLDQRESGKRLVLVTNSSLAYTDAMMSYAFDRFLPDALVWRDLFELVIVEAGKPGFFLDRSPLFEVVSPDGLLRPAPHGIERPGVYLGGHAALVERYLGLSGDAILYVGDHVYGDVRVSKSLLRWRTGLVLRELEDEILADEASRDVEARIEALMRDKSALESRACQVRLERLRTRRGYGPHAGAQGSDGIAELQRLKSEIVELDAAVAPLARHHAERSNKRWGPLMRAGNDKSHLARQVERSADIYMSRVSNLLRVTPFAYLRSVRGSLPHDAARQSEGASR